MSKLTFEQIIETSGLNRQAIDDVFEHTIRLMKANKLSVKAAQLVLARKRLEMFFEENAVQIEE